MVGKRLTRIAVEVCILAGGLSSRMGRDKATLRIGRLTFLGQIRKTARTLAYPVRVIRHDLVPRCGPLGGIYTALKTTSAEVLLFLACDMPKVREPLLRKLLKHATGDASIFTWNHGAAGFPFVLSRSALSSVEHLIRRKKFSLQSLANEIQAKRLRAGRGSQPDLLNI
ncbi:MAG: molybdenum cofactor guanylyltransferase, partial [Verrucomicrobiota bacterium]